jgi:hypothetical protein
MEQPGGFPLNYTTRYVKKFQTGGNGKADDELETEGDFRETTWPLLLVAVGIGLFLWNRRTLAGWIVGGIGIIFFVVNFVIFFFPEFENWTFLVGPIILMIIGVLLLHRSYHDSRHPRG